VEIPLYSGSSFRKNGYKNINDVFGDECLRKRKITLMNRIAVERRLSAKISPETVKLCEFCGALNLASNKECWTCCWHGGFSVNEQTIALAWQRLETLYEEVRIEHVTARRTSTVGEFGEARPASRLQSLVSGLAAWWQRFQNQRELRMAQRDARLNSRIRL
jgi:hypothetical protein